MIYPIHATQVDLERVASVRNGRNGRMASVGPGLRRSYTPGLGWTVEAVQGSKWRHPWYTRLIWSAALNQWTIGMVPGFVNGYAPIVQTTQAQAQTAAQQDFGINPLSGLPFFSDPIFNQGPESPETPDGTLDIPLYFNPLLLPSWRALGYDSNDHAPAFFTNLGVGAPMPQPTDDDLEDGDTSSLTANPPAGNRLLRACDLVLHQPRSALSSTITLGDGIATGISDVSQTLTLVPANPADRLKVYAIGQIPNNYNAGIDPVSGDYTEPNYDEILISTVYVLSPPNTAPYSSPDATWTPYVQHNLFWNLSYAQPPFAPTLDAADDAVSSLAAIGSVLGDGAAAGVVNFEAASINDAYQAATNILEAQSMAGFFWTPACGGHDSAFPATPPAAPVAASGLGLDKDGIALAAAQQAAQALVTAQLDPDFPYNSIQFNLALLDQ